MQKVVRFKLNAQETQLADALRLQLQSETGAVISLEDIIKRHFVNWMYNNLLKPGEQDEGQVNNESDGDQQDVPASVSGDALPEPAEEGTHS